MWASLLTVNYYPVATAGCLLTVAIKTIIIDVYTKHMVGDRETELNLLEESSGTKKLFGLMPFIADSLLSGTTLVIDELDAKIHPVLLRYVFWRGCAE